MTDSDREDPQAPPPAGGPDEPHHEGVVESLTEEVKELHEKVEEAVEQALPRRVRWSAGRIAWVIVLGVIGVLVLAVAGGVLWVTQHTEEVAGGLTAMVNRTLADRSDVVLEAHDVSGNPFRSVTILEPRVRFRGDHGPALLEARSMSLRYAPWDVLFGSRRAIEIELEGPVVRLARGPDGRLRLPHWRSTPGTRGRTRALDVRLTLRDGAIDLPETSLDVTGWQVDARLLTGGTEALEVANMRWAHGPYGTTLAALRGRVRAGDSVRVDVQELRTGDLELSGSARWAAGARGGRTASVDVKRVTWTWLARVFSNGLFDVPGEGGGHFDLLIDRGVAGTGTLAAVWDSVPVRARAGFRWEDGRLTLAPLDGTSPAGALSGRLVYTSRALDLRGRVTHGDPVHWRAIGLPGWPAGDVSGDLHYWSWRGASTAGSRLEAVVGPSALAGWRADSATVSVDAPSGAPGSFAVTMSRRGGRAGLEATMAQGAWEGTWRAQAYPLDEWPDGRATGIRGLLGEGRGTVASRAGALTITGTLEGPRSEWLGLQAGGWRLEDVSGTLLPKPDLVLPALRLRDATFLGVHFDSARAALRVGDATVRFDDVVAMGGDTVVTTAGTSAWGRSGWTTTLDGATARSRQFHWVSEGPLELAGDAQGVTFRRFAARDSASRVEVTGRWAGPGGSYDWTGRGWALDLHRLGLPPEWGIRGTADAVLRVTGRYGDPRWSLDAAASRPGWMEHRGDSLRLGLSGAPGRLDVEELTYRLGRGRLDALASFDGTARAWPDTLTGEGVRRWLASAASWRGRVGLQDFPLDRVNRLAPQARGLSGVLDGTLELGGRPDEPVLDLQARAAPLAWDSLSAEQVTVRAAYRDRRLTVEDLRLTRANSVSTASGSMPLVLALGAPPSVPGQPMSWRLDLANGDLALLPQLMPQVVGARGRLDAHATVAGTPQHPDLSGTAQVRDGQILPAGRGELIEGLRADFRLDEGRITMDTLSARSGRHGVITGHGFIDLSGARLGHYAFDLNVRDFTAVEPGFYAVEFDAPRLRVTDGPRIQGQVLPHVEGDVYVRGARVLFDFANQTETQQLAAMTQPLFWTYRIHLLANNNLRWQPPDGDLEFSGDLTLQQTERELKIFGDLHGIRGTYDFLSNRFDVTKADLTFDNVGGVNPLLDIEATTRIVPLARGQGAGGVALTGTGSSERPHTVTVFITNRAATPTITFESDPADWDQPTILSQLTVGRFLAGGDVPSQLSDPLDSYVTRMINAQLSPLLSSTFLRDVGQWRLERQQGGLFYGQGDVFVTVAHQFNPRVLVSYSQRVPGFERQPAASTASLLANPFERNVEAEYRLHRFFYVTTELGQRRSQAGTAPAVLVPDFNVNLKARWEY